MRFALISVVLLATGPLPAEDKPAEKPPDRARIEALVKQLGADDFAEREKAQAELEKLGEAAVPALKEFHAATDDAEVKTRLLSVISLYPLLKAIFDAQLASPLRTVTRPCGGTFRHALIMLDGSSSKAANRGTKLSYSWTLVQGAAANISQSDKNPAYAMAAVQAAGKYRFQLVVSSDRRKSPPAFVEVTVEDPDAKKKDKPGEEKK